jgi:hypothetical protein
MQHDRRFFPTVHLLCHNRIAAEAGLPPPARKTLDTEGRIVKQRVWKTVEERHVARDGLVKAVGCFESSLISR